MSHVVYCIKSQKSHLPSIIIDGIRAEISWFYPKFARKKANFRVKWRHISKEGTKSAEDSLETAGFCVVLSDFAEKWPVNHINNNLYHYAGNNPVKYTAPDGRWFFIDDMLYSFLAFYLIIRNQIGGRVQ